MKLSELKKIVDDAIERATEMGEDPTKIPVTLQLDQQVDGSIWSADQVELFYDGGAQATGCVLSAYLPEDDSPQTNNCGECHGMGWVPSKTEPDTDPCPMCEGGFSPQNHS